MVVGPRFEVIVMRALAAYRLAGLDKFTLLASFDWLRTAAD
jgi:hypothetical protein